MDGLRDAIRDLSAPVAVDLLEREEAYLLIIDLPGATPEDTTVTTSDGMLRIHADRTAYGVEGTTPVHQGRARTIEIELALPPDVEAEDAEASLANGVMELTLPRGEAGTHIPIEDG